MVGYLLYVFLKNYINLQDLNKKNCLTIFIYKYSHFHDKKNIKVSKEIERNGVQQQFWA